MLCFVLDRCVVVFVGIELIKRNCCRLRAFPAERVFEYQWPQDGGEWYLLQEQVSEYLGVLSFKRKYPGKHEKTHPGVLGVHNMIITDNISA